jgi:protein-tyrosine-phosphatase
MKAIGLDVSNKTSKRLTGDMVKRSDIVAAMVSKDTIPPSLQVPTKLKLWDIKDPKFMDYAGHVAIRDQIYKKVKELVKWLDLN